MIPKNSIIPKEEKPEILIPHGTRDISPRVAALIFKNLKDVTPDWWAEINELLKSKNVLDRKFAITEINKLQLKAMPTELTTGDGTDIKIAIINYGDTNSVQLQAETIPNTTPKRSGQRNTKSG